MTQIKKLGFGAIATALFAVLAMATMVNTAYADHAFDTPSTASAGSTITLTVSDLDGTETVVFERLASSTPTGFFVSNNNSTTLTCVNNADCDTDGDTDGTMTVQFFVSANSPAGSLTFSATVVGEDTQTDSTTVSASAGTATGLTITGPSTIANGTNSGADYTVFATDASGNRVAVTGVTVNASNRGLLAQEANVCVTRANNTVGDDDRECAINTVTSTTSPARFGVYENGSVGETILISAFVAPAGGNPALVGSLTVTIVAAPATATVTAPATVVAGSSNQVTVNVLDSAGRPAGATDVTVVASEGVVVCPVDAGNTRPQTTSGTLTCSFVAPGSAQTVVITAVVDVPNTATDIVATANVSVTGTATPGGTPTPTPGAGDCTFASAPSFGTGNVGSAVFEGGSIADLSCAVTDAGGTAVWVQGANGNWYRYNTRATGATAFVNNAFNAQFAAGFGTVAVFVVK